MRSIIWVLCALVAGCATTPERELGGNPPGYVQGFSGDWQLIHWTYLFPAAEVNVSVLFRADFQPTPADEWEVIMLQIERGDNTARFEPDRLTSVTAYGNASTLPVRLMLGGNGVEEDIPTPFLQDADSLTFIASPTHQEVNIRRSPTQTAWLGAGLGDEGRGHALYFRTTADDGALDVNISSSLPGQAVAYGGDQIASITWNEFVAAGPTVDLGGVHYGSRSFSWDFAGGCKLFAYVLRAPDGTPTAAGSGGPEIRVIDPDGIVEARQGHFLAGLSRVPGTWIFETDQAQEATQSDVPGLLLAEILDPDCAVR